MQYLKKTKTNQILGRHGNLFKKLWENVRVTEKSKNKCYLSNNIKEYKASQVPFA